MGKDREDFAEVYPKMKIHRVMNGFQAIAFNNVYIFKDDERGRKELFDFFCDWVAKNSAEKKPVTDVITPLTTTSPAATGSGSAANSPQQPQPGAQQGAKPATAAANTPKQPQHQAQPERRVKQ